MIDAISAPAPDLAGRHAVITGGGSGIGAAIAAELASRGATLSLMARDLSRLQSTADGLRDSYDVDVHAIACDVSQADAVIHAFAAAREAAGEPHILINNAGIAEAAPLAEMEMELWTRTIGVDLTGVFLCTREALPAMQRARSGRIVNVASTAGLRGYSRLTAYCAAKHGVIGLTRALAQETARQGITVNAVCPGYTDTEMSRDAVEAVMSRRGVSREEAEAMITRNNPRGDLIRPEEVASLVGWLCSGAASGVTGAALPVAGGEVG